MSSDIIHKYAWPNATAVAQTLQHMACNETSSNLSGCNDFEEDSGDYIMPIDAYISIFLILLFGAIGLIGNGTLVFIVILNRDMRTVPNVLIASLALGDFLFLLISVPFTVISNIHNTYVFGEAVCKFTSMLPVMSEGVSVFTLAAMSHDRYTAIVKPMHRRKSGAAMRIYTLAVSIWIMSFMLSIPSLVLSYVESKYTPYKFCFYLPHETKSAKIHETFRCILMFILPLLVISVYYMLIALKLLESSLNMPGEGVADTGQATKQVRARRRLARTVLVLVVLFGLCWLPHFIYRLMFQFNFDEDLFMTTGMYVFQLLSNLLTYLNACINPVALCFLSKTYRKYYLKYLCCRHGGILTTGLLVKGTTYQLSPTNPDCKRAMATDDSFRNSSVETKTCTV
ncbi:LOW QUALITY PROTEIN: bombesin receptor subtype-3-like [Amphiura filiformis]|uniref:LOW QUALITY PROTEIN: bombesin receptor subtype-3-like n=1 Tax=Amphiura filiformis TaxID=82378 RepID=UPI003B20CBED